VEAEVVSIVNFYRQIFFHGWNGHFHDQYRSLFRTNVYFRQYFGRVELPFNS